MAANTLLIACGALAKELVQLTRRNEWSHVRVQCLPPELHNTPEKIPAEVVAIIEENQRKYDHIFVGYADCGTGGMLDKALAKYGIERLPGAHCYEFFTGSARFAALCDDEPGTYYLTDFLVRHFDRLVVRALGLDRYPQLRDEYFRNYRRVVYLAQSQSDDLSRLARSHAAFLGLDYEEQFTGLAPVNNVLNEHIIQWQN
ncbi:MAG: DUF1638 domain-containing protein [Woeseiaceae bacterium]|nr:DUF1638 domain-containing protein [Woeseiaceae bacterium]